MPLSEATLIALCREAKGTFKHPVLCSSNLLVILNKTEENKVHMGITVGKSLRSRSKSKVSKVYESAKRHSSSSGSSGSGASTAIEFLTPAARIRSMRIDRQLAKEKESLEKHIKILILGTAESGKSTLFKQMKILHMKGFSSVDLYGYRHLLHRNCVDALSMVLWGKRQLKVPSDTKSLDDDIANFEMFIQSVKGTYLLDPIMASIMERIWENSTVQAVFNQRWSIQLPDSTAYLLNSLERICAVDYCPTVQDVLHSRKPTTGINEIRFKFRETRLHMVDLGGQNSEQKKWIHCFDNVQGVLFIVSMSDFDLIVPPDDSPRKSSEDNRLRYALEIFGNLVGCTYLAKAAFILFLNKKDVLEEKVKHKQLSHCFPEYKGANTYDEASHYILTKFVAKIPKEKELFAHFTQATDTQNVDYVFNVCMNKALKTNLTQCGMV